jgi:hypothetical protein
VALRVKRTAIVFVVAAAGIVAVAVLWSRPLATIRCADGSSLVILEATFGRAHQSVPPARWAPSMRGASPYRRALESIRDPFRSPAERLKRKVPFFWRAEAPAVALWGAWAPRGTNAHSLGFVLRDDSVHGATSLAMHLPLTRQESWGLVATTTNVPLTKRLTVQVFEECTSNNVTLLCEFTVRNKLL